MTIVAFTGIREIDPSMMDEVEMAVLDEIGAGATELRFGGAIGADTMALAATCDHNVRSVVYVPFTLNKQPIEARKIIKTCATEVIELDLPCLGANAKASYLQRNRIMIKGAHRVVAFTDGRKTGGTSHTIQAARSMGIPVTIVPVESTTRHNPELTGFSAKVFGLTTYVSASERYHALSSLIRRNKIGDATQAQLHGLARRLTSFIKETPELSSATAIVAMPRRRPDLVSDMQPVAWIIAHNLDLELGTLKRVIEPVGGELLHDRLRFPADVHERTMEYSIVFPDDHSKVIVLDNVVTTGRTMEGALRAVARTGAKPVGLGVLFLKALEKAE